MEAERGATAAAAAAAVAACAAAAACSRCAAPGSDGSGDPRGLEVQPGLFISDPDMELADDATLAATCECPREVYIEGDESLRRAFAPATIVKVLRGEESYARYADGTCKYSEGALTVGEPAPDFAVLEVRRGPGVDLFSTDHLGPTTLLAPLTHSTAAMEKLRQRFCEQVEFVKVYVSEAHPTDEWAVYTRKDIDYCQPKTLSERLAAARRLLTEEVIEARFVLAPMDNALEQAYAAHPERLYLVDPHGRIVYKGGMGPFGYLPDELEEFIIQHVLR